MKKVICCVICFGLFLNVAKTVFAQSKEDVALTKDEIADLSEFIDNSEAIEEEIQSLSREISIYVDPAAAMKELSEEIDGLKQSIEDIKSFALPRSLNIFKGLTIRHIDTLYNNLIASKIEAGITADTESFERWKNKYEQEKEKIKQKYKIK